MSRREEAGTAQVYPAVEFFQVPINLELHYLARLCETFMRLMHWVCSVRVCEQVSDVVMYFISRCGIPTSVYTLNLLCKLLLSQKWHSGFLHYLSRQIDMQYCFDPRLFCFLWFLPFDVERQREGYYVS